MSPQMRISYNLAEGEKARSKNYFAPISFLFLMTPFPWQPRLRSPHWWILNITIKAPSYLHAINEMYIVF